MKISISRLINYNKIRHNRLIDLVNIEYCNSGADVINLYIDLNSLLRSIYGQDIAIEDYLELTSSIINLCGFYRSFFRRYYDVHTRIYIVYSNNTPPDNITIYPEYNSKNKKMIDANKYVTSYIAKTLNLLDTICPYIPDVQFCIDYCETGVIIQYLKELQTKNFIPNIVLSRDPYNFQLVDDNTKVLVPYKERDVSGNIVDSSYFATLQNAIYFYCLKNKSILPVEYSDINGYYLPLFMAISRCPQRNIKSINKITKALNMLRDIDLANKVKSDVLLQNRYYVCDIRQQLETYRISPSKHIITAEISNLYNKEEIQNLNNKYFSKYPLELESL